mmetsp:Transcript_30142/g.76178  ORF Transcript_30142/g.76178 Transcript_30142/m.76178 type:complete len:321 (-) Transcript_30142:1280-2242(-)
MGLGRSPRNSAASVGITSAAHDTFQRSRWRGHGYNVDTAEGHRVCRATSRRHDGTQCAYTVAAVAGRLWRSSTLVVGCSPSEGSAEATGSAFSAPPIAVDGSSRCCCTTSSAATNGCRGWMCGCGGGGCDTTTELSTPRAARDAALLESLCELAIIACVRVVAAWHGARSLLGGLSTVGIAEIAVFADPIRGASKVHARCTSIMVRGTVDRLVDEEIPATRTLWCSFVVRGCRCRPRVALSPSAVAAAMAATIGGRVIGAPTTTMLVPVMARGSVTVELRGSCGAVETPQDLRLDHPNYVVVQQDAAVPISDHRHVMPIA